MPIYRAATLDGTLDDAEDVIVGSTNATLFAYVADGRNGLKVLQLTTPDSQPNFYGFSPAPKPELIAWARTKARFREIALAGFDEAFRAGVLGQQEAYSKGEPQAAIDAFIAKNAR